MSLQVIKTLAIAACGLLVAVTITYVVDRSTSQTTLLPGTPTAEGLGLIPDGKETAALAGGMRTIVIDANGKVVSGAPARRPSATSDPLASRSKSKSRDD